MADNAVATLSEVDIRPVATRSSAAKSRRSIKSRSRRTGDIALTGNVTATHLIQATAGTDGTGSITGDINTQLTTFGSQIILTAGGTDGDITLTDSALTGSTSTGFISLTALGGQIAQTGGAATGKQFKARAKDGITANTVVSEYDVQNSGTGDVTLLNVGDVTFTTPLAAPNGDIDVTIFGTLTVAAINGSQDITLRSTDTFSQTSGTTISGGALTLANAPMAATRSHTAVTALNLTTSGPGDVVVNNTGTQPLDLNVAVTDGSLNVTTAGKLLVTQAVSLTNRDSNDIRLQAAGDIEIGNVNAGVFAETDADAQRIRLSYLSGALRAAGFLSAGAADLTETTYAALDLAAARTALVDWLTATSFPGDIAEEADRQLNLQQPLRTLGDVTLISGGAIREVGRGGCGRRPRRGRDRHQLDERHDRRRGRIRPPSRRSRTPTATSRRSTSTGSANPIRAWKSSASCNTQRLGLVHRARGSRCVRGLCARRRREDRADLRRHVQPAAGQRRRHHGRRGERTGVACYQAALPGQWLHRAGQGQLHVRRRRQARRHDAQHQHGRADRDPLRQFDPHQGAARVGRVRSR